MNRITMTAIAGAAATLALATPAAAQGHQVLGKETTISFAANGGIRHWQPGPRGSNIVYVQDRTLRWYRVALSGPCLQSYSLDSMRYRTGPNGRFDRFTRVWSTRFPGRICGVDSIKTSLPPKHRPGAKQAQG